MKKHLVLDQYRKASDYNDFIGKFYHFPKKYLNLLSGGNIEFIYYEPQKRGQGEYFGYGNIEKEPFKDNREDDFYFVEITNFKQFKTPISLKNENGPRETPPYYNPQNSVRNIRQEILEEICLDGNIILHFTSDSHLIDVLGEQLIASEKVGILELIKNAYDAHATYCNVTIGKIPGLPEVSYPTQMQNQYDGPVIIVDDDGTGMDMHAIQYGWLRPASTIKTNVKEQLKKERETALKENKLGVYDELISQLKKVHKSRIPLGEKGVGRFATHRLGKKLLIKTKVKEKDYEYVLEIDWTNFKSLNGDFIDLDSVGMSLKKQLPSRDYGATKSGTQLIIYGGKDNFAWDKDTIKELNRTILCLKSPYKEESSVKHKSQNTTTFDVSFICPQVPDLSKTLLNEDYPPVISFVGIVDEMGKIDYEISFKPPKSIPMLKESKSGQEDLRSLTNGIEKYWVQNGEFRKPTCGKFMIDIDVWYRKKPWIDGPNSDDFFKYLDIYGGISIYRDGFIACPAEQGKEADWLGLSRRQIKQAFRISYYHMIGKIDLEQSYNYELTDMTNREGLIKNTGYNDFVKLVKGIIECLLEPEYRSKRDRYEELTSDIVRSPRKLESFISQGKKLVSKIKDSYPLAEDPYSIVQEFGSPETRKEKLVNLERSLANLKESLNVIEEAKNLLTEHAGFGIAIAVSIHEIAKITSNFYIGIGEIIKQGADINKLKELQESSLSLKSELKRLSPLRAVRNEPPKEFTLSRAVKYVSDIYENELKQNNVSLETNIEQDIQVYGRFGTILQVFANLFLNSIYWLNTPDVKEKKICINVNSKDRFVIFADNGPGIHEAIRSHLFEAGYSLRTPGSGLGLYICKYYMQDIYGDIYLTTARERLENYAGAQFTLDFSNSKSKGV